MHFNVKQLYTPTLEIYELNERALIVDTETVGAGPTVEIIEIAFGNTEGEIVYESLVQPVFNALPPPSKHHRFSREELRDAPLWKDIWPQVSALIDGRLLVAYNAAFDRRAFAAECSRYHQSSTERGWRCAMQLVKKTVGCRRSPTLSEACAFYGLEGGNHRAARDVQATCQLLKALAALEGLSRRGQS
ncbi:MAG TPA: 3'-5' exonuclease [Pyrinomonadaceae bacterium]|jgi:DNA polymerase-3 subunit epsilon|nr:3'-5' exonuclease [Pyrinomonadaceae bacterium]